MAAKHISGLIGSTLAEDQIGWEGRSVVSSLWFKIRLDQKSRSVRSVSNLLGKAMPDAFFRKVSSTTLVAASDHDAGLLKHIKLGDPTKLTFRRVRNYEFLQKYMVLLRFAFDQWEPPPNYVGEKNFDQFRADVTILSGHYHQWIRLDGTTRTVAKSIAFQNMPEDEFEQVYTKSVDVIIKHVNMQTRYTPEQLRNVVQQLEAFE